MIGLTKGYIKTVRARNHIQHWFRNNEPTEKIPEAEQKITAKPKLKQKLPGHDHTIPRKTFTQNVSNYLTKFSRCCKPLPGDKVIGYITQKAGLSVHRLDCSNFNYLKAKNPQRVLDISLADKHGEAFPVDLEIVANSSAKLLNLITTTLANANMHIVAISEQANKASNTSNFFLTIKIYSMNDLQHSMSIFTTYPM